MTVLFLRRQSLGGIATHSESLAAALGVHGITVSIEDATAWIPNETGPKVDKKVSERLRKVAGPYDLVHAFGYRAAWACSHAFSHKEAWVYTAYDLPKTTHRLLISALNDAQAGIVSSHAVFRALDEAIALDLNVIPPGIATLTEPPPPKAKVKTELGFDPDAPLIGVMARMVPERGVRAVIDAMETVWNSHPDTQLLVAGEGPEQDRLKRMAADASNPTQIRFQSRVSDKDRFFGALDLLVVPSTRAAFSMVALEGMARSVPVLLRHTGGLPEMIDEDVSGYLFDSDEQLGPRIIELLDMPLAIESAGRAGRIRSLELFSLDRCAEMVADLYRSVVEGV